MGYLVKTKDKWPYEPFFNEHFNDMTILRVQDIPLNEIQVYLRVNPMLIFLVAKFISVLATLWLLMLLKLLKLV